jgi:hypothetical protein
MLAFSAAIVLACGGGGTAIKQDTTTISGEQSGSYDYGRGSYDGTFDGTVTGTRQQGYVDQVDVEIDGDSGRIRLPRAVLPPIRGGKDGWFDLRNVKQSDRTIEASAGINFMNRPKVHIDRVTGTISINGMNGNYVGQCKRVDPAAERQF